MPGGARGNYLIVRPLPNCSFEEYAKYRHSKTSCPDLYHVQKAYATKASPQVRIKKRKKLPESPTTQQYQLARHLNVVKRSCKDT